MVVPSSSNWVGLVSKKRRNTAFVVYVSSTALEGQPEAGCKEAEATMHPAERKQNLQRLQRELKHLREEPVPGVHAAV